MSEAFASHPHTHRLVTCGYRTASGSLALLRLVGIVRAQSYWTAHCHHSYTIEDHEEDDSDNDRDDCVAHRAIGRRLHRNGESEIEQIQRVQSGEQRDDPKSREQEEETPPTHNAVAAYAATLSAWI